MVEILQFLADHCGFLFNAGFRFVDSQAESDHGSAMVLLETDILRLRLSHHRGELLLEFQPVRGKRSDWFSLGLLRGVLLGQRGGSEVLNPTWAAFLSDWLDELERRLTEPDKASELLGGLKSQARLRAKELFG